MRSQMLLRRDLEYLKIHEASEKNIGIKILEESITTLRNQNKKLALQTKFIVQNNVMIEAKSLIFQRLINVNKLLIKYFVKSILKLLNLPEVLLL